MKQPDLKSFQADVQVERENSPLVGKIGIFGTLEARESPPERGVAQSDNPLQIAQVVYQT
jgi:hypothetical protein